MPIFAKRALNGGSNSGTEAKHYLVAFVGVIAAAGLRYMLGPVLAGLIPVVLFTVPVTVSAVYGGFGPAIFATLSSTLVATYLFIPPQYSLRIEDSAGTVTIVVFLLIGSIISWLGKRLKELQFRTKQQAQALVEENKRKDDFLAMLAHELRNPLAGISTAAELLKFAHRNEKLLPMTSEVITRQVKHMTKLVDDLLDVSRLAHGLVIIDKHPVDMNDIVRDAIEQTQSLFDEKAHQLTTQMLPAPACVCGDYTRLVQIVANLLGNAAKYTLEGGRIALIVDVDAAEVKISVHDNGLGMTRELLLRVFEPFVQAERSADRSPGGLGLGLALVQRIAQLHDGTITAHSEGLGKGSTLILRLPHWKKPAAARNREPAQEGRLCAEYKAMVRPLKLMVVDDNRDAALGLATILQNQGHTVVVAYNAKQALDLAYADNFDAFLLDIGLPDVDGYELLRLLRLIPHVSAAMFIAVSGYGRDEDKNCTKSAGFHHHFVKPVHTPSLAKILHHIVPMH